MIAPRQPSERYWIGCDVGSTAVKVAALEAGSFRVLARHYLRHGTRQVDAVVRLLGELERESPGMLQRSGLFFTGSGGRVLATRSGCDFVQEVNAVALATERLYPEAGSIVDIGGQDAKIIIWTRDPATGRPTPERAEQFRQAHPEKYAELRERARVRGGFSGSAVAKVNRSVASGRS